MEKLFNLQMFADDAAVATEPGTAENLDVDKAAADTGKEAPKPEKKYTDDDVDKIVSKRLAREREQAKKEKEEAEKLAEMNAQQKAEYKLAEAEKRIAELERKETLAEMSKVARKMLAEENINISDELLAMMVTTDAQQTKQNIESYIKLHKADVEAGIKARLRGEAPRRSSGADSPVSEIDKRIKKYL
jgi:hypothetical protein